jgi:hypothetical protein
LERETAAVNPFLLATLEGTPALLRACNVVDDVVKLANCALLALDLKGIIIASLTELLLK